MTPRSLGDLLDEAAGYGDEAAALVAEAYERGRYDMGHGWNTPRRIVAAPPLPPLPSLPPLPRAPRTAPGAFLG